MWIHPKVAGNSFAGALLGGRQRNWTLTPTSLSVPHTAPRAILVLATPRVGTTPAWSKLSRRHVRYHWIREGHVSCTPAQHRHAYVWTRIWLLLRSRAKAFVKCKAHLTNTKKSRVDPGNECADRQANEGTEDSFQAVLCDMHKRAHETEPSSTTPDAYCAGKRRRALARRDNAVTKIMGAERAQYWSAVSARNAEW